MKNYANTYLYRKYNEYEKQIFTFVMNADIVDKESTSFEDIEYDVKRRQVSSKLVKILKSDKVVLLIGGKPLPKAFKVSCMKDVRKGSNERKIFIDVTGIIYRDSSSKYVCKEIDVLISYLVSAVTNMVYYTDERRLIGNSRVIDKGTACFSKAFTYVVDYVAKISNSPDARYKCSYMSAMYFLSSIAEKDINEGSINVAKKISGISDREIDIINLQTGPNTYTNIKSFVEDLAKVIRVNKLTLDVLVEKWMYIFGTGTVFSLEHFPSFCTMITDAYVGAYINNQKTIEKIIGKDMVDFSKIIIEVGESCV